MQAEVVMRRLFVSVLVLLVPVAACGKKGLPEECEQYLARYDCWLGKSGVADKQTTIDVMRKTWTDASKSGPGRAAIVGACEKSQAEMEQKFASSGCATATPAAH
jgi:hypothetical protein